MSTRTIKAKDVIADIRSGMTDRQLMDKYRVSSRGLHKILEQLLNAGAIEKCDLNRLFARPIEQPVIRDQREVHRHYAFVRVPIFDLENLLQQGTIVDVSIRGLKTSGIQAELGDTKELLIQADYFGDIFPFVLEAQCRWSSRGKSGEWLAGFIITKITQRSLLELRKLTQALTLGE